MTTAGGGGSASSWVRRHLGGVSAGGVVLDVACGGGRHLRLALEHGHPVVGIDRDLARVDDLVGRTNARLIEADLEHGAPFPVAGEMFEGVIVTNYLWRPLLPAIVAAVSCSGVLIYETFALGNARYGRPSNPDFLLQPGELLEAVRPSLVPMAFEHVTCSDPSRVVQRIVAVGRDHKWLNTPPAA